MDRPGVFTESAEPREGCGAESGETSSKCLRNWNAFSSLPLLLWSNQAYPIKKKLFVFGRGITDPPMSATISPEEAVVGGDDAEAPAVSSFDLLGGGS